jgi:hypothetical protein
VVSKRVDTLLGAHLTVPSPAVPLLAFAYSVVVFRYCGYLRVTADALGPFHNEHDTEDTNTGKVVFMTLSQISIFTLIFFLERSDMTNGQSLVDVLPSSVTRTDASQNGGGIIFSSTCIVTLT